MVCALRTPGARACLEVGRGARAGDDRPGRDADHVAFGEGRRCGEFQGRVRLPPMLAYCDESGEALAGMLQPGQRGAHNVATRSRPLKTRSAQIPVEHIEEIEILLRCDSAGTAHDLVDWCREGRIGFSVGFDLTEAVRGAILELPETAWIAALDKDGTQRPNGQVAEITHLVDLTGWPERSRLICRRERAHPGAQLSFTDHDGHRFQVFLTDQNDPDIAVLERHQRQRAHVEDHIRNDKDTGLAQAPVQRLPDEPGVALSRADRSRPRHLDTNAAADRRAHQSRAQAPALPDPAHRRTARIPRTTRPTAPNAPGPGRASSPPRSRSCKRSITE